MLYHGATDSVLCRAFPTFLGKIAVLWFASLPLGSIRSFDDLSRIFLSRFTISRVYHKTGVALHYIRQGQYEPLREYLNRFQAIVADIPNFDPQFELFCIQHGLKLGPFADQIALIEPKDMAEFYEKSTSFIKMKGQREVKKIDWKNLKVMIDDKRSKRDIKSEDRSRHEQRNGRGRGKQKLPPNADQSKKCAYHDTYRHTPKECVMLGDQLEDLVHIGHLDKYLHHMRERGRSRSRDLRRRSRTPPRSQKDHSQANEPRGFLVDQGSSGGILFHSTFEKMQLTEASFIVCKGDLVGFSRERIDVCGAIWLRTTFNSQPKAKTIDECCMSIRRKPDGAIMNASNQRRPNQGMCLSARKHSLGTRYKQSAKNLEPSSGQDMRKQPHLNP
ncbi:hypothetical protein Cni_G09457 [Canna indica]|uniref:Retrotransposon gag domain-containing protein n=1 Tax=Canna indica TaxID=4628 RepID=A0AAQ3K2C7_9LILI|nr:hypothetical protein Cni_G09457 [Canna indica]